MLADDRLMAGQGMGVDWQSESRGSRPDRVALSAEGTLSPPPVGHRIEGIPRNFSSTFPATGFVCQTAIPLGSDYRLLVGFVVVGGYPCLGWTV